MLFDAHLHIFEPAFPLPGNQGYIPKAFTVEDYRRRTASLGVVGRAVVAASTQGEDPQPLLAAARALGEGFVVIAAAHPGQDDATFAALAASGVRGLRFTLHRGAAFDVPAMPPMPGRRPRMAFMPSSTRMRQRSPRTWTILPLFPPALSSTISASPGRGYR